MSAQKPLEKLGVEQAKLVKRLDAGLDGAVERAATDGASECGPKARNAYSHRRRPARSARSSDTPSDS